MDFFKAHGTANDFVLLPDPDDRLELSDVLVRALADRRRGLGADGVIRVVGPGRDTPVFMDYRNADGSVVEMCGNGVRVVAKHVVDHGLVAPDELGGVVVGTRSGPRTVWVVRWHADGTVAEVAVDMGPPELTPRLVPFEADDPDDRSRILHVIELDGSPAQLAGRRLEIAVVSMGNPHAVTLVDEVGTAPVAEVGSAVETHRRFPAKANVGFAQVLDEGRIRLRVWERGVGETAACGTGACAAVVALQRLGHVGGDVAVELPGGTLWVSHPRDGSVIMTGPAVEVAVGRLDDAWLAAARGGDMEAAP